MSGSPLWKGLAINLGPACQTEAGGKSAAAAIAARKSLGLWVPKNSNQLVSEHRACWAYLSGCGLPKIVKYAAYLHDSEGPLQRICRILEAIGGHITDHNSGRCVGADLNMEPDRIASTGLLGAIGGRIAAGFASIGTCAAATPASNIDCFIVDRRLGEVRIITDSTLKTHRPIRLHWKPKMEEIRIRMLKTKKLPSTMLHHKDTPAAP